VAGAIRDMVVCGAPAIGDTANKIGTYSMAVNATYWQTPRPLTWACPRGPASLLGLVQHGLLRHHAVGLAKATVTWTPGVSSASMNGSVSVSNEQKVRRGPSRGVFGPEEYPARRHANPGRAHQPLATE